jgi:hypothetical protein
MLGKTNAELRRFTMYRLFVLALALTMTLAFAGCGAKDQATPTQPDETVTTPDEGANDEAAAPAASAGSSTEPSDTAAASGDEGEDMDASWDEFEVVPSASASATKKE